MGAEAAGRAWAPAMAGTAKVAIGPENAAASRRSSDGRALLVRSSILGRAIIGASEL